MTTLIEELQPCLNENQSEIIQKIWEGKYKPNPVRRVEIPENGKDVIQSE